MSQHADVKRRIPTFSSLEEEAAFWDTHDTTEFEDEFEPVELEISDPLLHSIALRFDGPTFKRLLVIARQQGVGPVALAQRWVEEAMKRADAELAEPTLPDRTQDQIR